MFYLLLGGLCLAALYRLLWRRRYGTPEITGQVLRLSGAVAGPKPIGELIYARFSGQAIAPFELLHELKTRYLVFPSETHLAVHCRKIRVGDRIVVDGLPGDDILTDISYREVQAKPTLVALQISRRVWPRLRFLNTVMMVAALPLIGLASYDLLRTMHRPQLLPPTLSCPRSTDLRTFIVRDADTPEHQHSKVKQWCERDGKRQGPWEVWWDAAQKYQAGSYNSDKREGPWTTWHWNGQIASRGQYRHGHRAGSFSYWWPNARLMRQGAFDNAGQRRGVWFYFARNGTLEWRKDYSASSEATWDPITGRLSALLQGGSWKKWHESGVLVEAGLFRQGKKDGQWTSWDSAGHIQSQGEYRNGVRDGEWHFWHAKGRLRARGQYVCDRLDGRWTWWHPNGRRSGRGRYLVGAQYGHWIAWHDNGERERAGFYYEGKQEGRWIEWHPNGRVANLIYYDEGEKVGWEESFDEHGALRELAL
jgi:antitoxin component YwqK of YwqJK toxin-antitoxin module